MDSSILLTVESRFLLVLRMTKDDKKKDNKKKDDKKKDK